MINHSGNLRKYSDAFKIQMVEECRVLGATVPIVSNRHGVPTSRIYAWRMDKRYQGDAEPPQDTGFVEVAVAGEPAVESSVPSPVRAERIEITLENGRRLSVSDGVNAEFVLELARGLAA